MANYLTQEEVKNTIQLDNFVLRNLQVTNGYYRISQGMRKVIGSRNISWTTFATHASKTAGQALRHELMPRLVKSTMMRLAGHDNTFFFYNNVLTKEGQSAENETENALAEALKKVSLLVSQGNVVVFTELAPPFVDFINLFRKAWIKKQDHLRAFLDNHFVPGPLEAGGQDLLREAFISYYDARFETDSKRKSELILLGNLLIGLHEQTRLQPVIEKAMSVPLSAFMKFQDEAKPAKKRCLSVDKMSRQIITRAATQMWMLITLPSRELKLSQNIIAPTGVHSFPIDLLDIEHPRCRELAISFDSSLETLSNSAADDWSSLKDRMKFVVNFFRSHQQYKRMFEAPFLEDQGRAIEAGHLPAGPL